MLCTSLNLTPRAAVASLAWAWGKMAKTEAINIMCVPHYQTYLFAKQLQLGGNTKVKPIYKDKLRRTYRSCCCCCWTRDESKNNSQDILAKAIDRHGKTCVKRKIKGRFMLDKRIRYKNVGHVDSLTYKINVTI